MERSNLLVTAAHCVQDKDTGSLYDKFLFERCYDSGKASEKLTFKTVALKEYWYSEKNWKWDYAIAVLNTNSAATPLKYSTEDISNKIVTTFGYPGNYYDGNQMVFVEGNVLKNHPYDTWRINGCKMRGGSSGGAWVLEDNKTIVGVNSYGPVSETLAYECSPIFDENFESLYKYVLTLM
jgi:V8-like Glu-specific endopeptidase